jgi:hypothetical protein
LNDPAREHISSVAPLAIHPFPPGCQPDSQALFFQPPLQICERRAHVQYLGKRVRSYAQEHIMKSTEEFLLSQAVLASESANDPVEIPAELLIATNLGLRLFPVIGHSKHATSKVGIEIATSDPNRIGYWIRYYSGSPLSWYLAAGPGPLAEDGVVALEVIGDQGRAALCELCQDDWDWIDTLRSQVGNDTRYILFRWPAGMAMRRSARRLAPGLVLHGEGDCFPVPPSQTRSGIIHAYLTPRAALANAPEWLIKVAFQVVEAVADSQIDSIGGLGNSSCKQTVYEQPGA